MSFIHYGDLKMTLFLFFLDFKIMRTQKYSIDSATSQYSDVCNEKSGITYEY